MKPTGLALIIARRLMEHPMTYFIETRFDDGDAISEDVFVHNSLVGAVWTNGEGMGWEARAVSNIAGYWAANTTKFSTREAALSGLLASSRVRAHLNPGLRR